MQLIILVTAINAIKKINYSKALHMTLYDVMERAKNHSAMKIAYILI